MISLYDALKNSYSKKNKADAFKNKGYIYDNSLSDKNNDFYYHPENKKLIHTVKGTNPYDPRDIMTDLYLLGGKLKNTSRYKNSEQKLKEAKEKYKPDKVSIAGDSLGGSIASYIASPQDQVTTLNKGATFFQPIRSNENAFRVQNDLVSLLNAGATRMKTLTNPNNIKNPFSFIKNPLNAHNVENIKDSDVYI